MRKLVLLLFLCLIAVGSLPVAGQVGSVSIPIGSDSYKITVSEDGIYEVSYEDLQAADMDVAAVNPNTFEMMHKGEPMAYQLIGDGDDQFETGEAVRFFGWAFDGSNHDGWFVDENQYWLWANGSPTRVDVRLSSPDGMVVDSWQSTLIFEQNNHLGHTNTNDWDEFEFVPDMWFSARIASNPDEMRSLNSFWTTPDPELNITPEMGQPFREYTVEVFDPVSDGAAATMTTEVYSFCEPSQIEVHTFAASLNGSQQIDQWSGRYGRSFDQIIPASSLIDGDNLLRYDALTSSEDIRSADTCGSRNYNSDLLLPNRSILEYERHLAAVDDQLLFTYSSSGTHRFMVSNFTTGTPDSAIVWDVTNRPMPSVVTLSDSDISDEGGAFTWMIGDENLTNGEYLATTIVKTPDSISQYVAPNLTKANVEWLAVSHANFIEEAERMAAYRAGTTTEVMLSNGSTIPITAEAPRVTHIVDVADVINQYGYGYNLPQAIQAYYQDAYLDWSNGELKYGVLFGDATINPRQLNCVESCSYDERGEWDSTFETFVVTDMAFYDRFTGLIPTDHTYANLVDDGSAVGLTPEIAVGRFAVNTPEETKNAVDKVILYEYNQQIDATHMENLIFVADNAGGGGDFCSTTYDVADNSDYVDAFPAFSETGGALYCLDEYMADGTLEGVASAVMRGEVFEELNTVGAAIVNYRGHSGRYSLSGIFNANRDVDDTFSANTVSAFMNYDRPLLWIDIASLAGDFAYPTVRESAISERLIRLGGSVGTAGHWGAVGLHFDREGGAMQEGFYEALYTLDESNEPRGPYTVGDAIVYAKTRYQELELENQLGQWSYTYQGDPAMAMPAATFVQDYGDYEPQENTAVTLTPTSTNTPIPPTIPPTNTPIATSTSILVSTNTPTPSPTATPSTPSIPLAVEQYQQPVIDSHNATYRTVVVLLFTLVLMWGVVAYRHKQEIKTYTESH